MCAGSHKPLDRPAWEHVINMSESIGMHREAYLIDFCARPPTPHTTSLVRALCACCRLVSSRLVVARRVVVAVAAVASSLLLALALLSRGLSSFDDPTRTNPRPRRRPRPRPHPTHAPNIYAHVPLAPGLLSFCLESIHAIAPSRRSESKVFQSSAPAARTRRIPTHTRTHAPPPAITTPMYHTPVDR